MLLLFFSFCCCFFSVFVFSLPHPHIHLLLHTFRFFTYLVVCLLFKDSLTCRTCDNVSRLQHLFLINLLFCWNYTGHFFFIWLVQLPMGVGAIALKNIVKSGMWWSIYSWCLFCFLTKLWIQASAVLPKRMRERNGPKHWWWHHALIILCYIYMYVCVLIQLFMD